MFSYEPALILYILSSWYRRNPWNLERKRCCNFCFSLFAINGVEEKRAKGVKDLGFLNIINGT